MLHAPFFSEETHGTTPARVWAQLEALHKDGRARAIGVSNFSVSHLEKLLKTAKIVPAVNQIELHPYLYDRELQAYTQRQRILLSAYGPLAPIVRFSGGPLDAVLERVATRCGKSREVVLLRWGIQKGWAVITTSSKVQRLKDMGQQEGWALTADEVDEIERVGGQWKRRAFWNDEYAALETSRL